MGLIYDIYIYIDCIVNAYESCDLLCVVRMYAVHQCCLIVRHTLTLIYICGLYYISLVHDIPVAAVAAWAWVCFQWTYHTH